MAMIENILKTPTTIEVVFDAKMSNPNGDPDNENAPRQNSEGFGYMTPECIKYKIRNVLNIMANFGEIDPDTNHLYCSPLSSLQFIFHFSSKQKSGIKN